MKNSEIIAYLNKAIKGKGVTLSWVSKVAKIDYQRLYRILNYGAALNASELLQMCSILEIDPATFY